MENVQPTNNAAIKKRARKAKNAEAGKQLAVQNPPRPMFTYDTANIQDIGKSPTIQAILSQLQELRIKNNMTDDKLLRTTAQIDRRLVALANKKDKEGNAVLQASAFHPDRITQLRSQLGLKTGYNDVTDIADVVQRLISDPEYLHPPPIDCARTNGLVVKTICKRVKQVENLTAGHDILFVCQRSAVHRGIWVFDLNPESGAVYVLDKIIPSAHPQDFAITIEDLCTFIEFNCTTLVGGTTTTIASPMITIYDASVNPMMIGSGYEDQVGDSMAITTRPASDATFKAYFFNGGEDPRITRRGLRGNKLSTTALAFPNEIENGSIVRSNTFGRLENNVVQVFTGNDATTYKANGYLAYASFGSSVSINTTGTVIWSLATAVEANRVIRWGDFNINIGQLFTTPITSSHFTQFDVIVTYDKGDGSGGVDVVSLSFVSTVGSAGATIPTYDFGFTTVGQSKFAPYYGRFISDIRIKAIASGDTSTISFNASNAMIITVEWLDAQMGEKFDAIRLQNFQNGQSTNFRAVNHHFVIKDMASVEGTQQTSHTTEKPFSRQAFAEFMLMHNELTSGPSEEKLTAGSFFKSAGKILRVGGKVGKFVAPFLPPGASSMVSNASTAARRLGRGQNVSQNFPYQSGSFTTPDQLDSDSWDYDTYDPRDHPGNHVGQHSCGHTGDGIYVDDKVVCGNCASQVPKCKNCSGHCTQLITANMTKGTADFCPDCFKALYGSSPGKRFESRAFEQSDAVTDLPDFEDPPELIEDDHFVLSCDFCTKHLYFGDEIHNLWDLKACDDCNDEITYSCQLPATGCNSCSTSMPPAYLHRSSVGWSCDSCLSGLKAGDFNRTTSVFKRQPMQPSSVKLYASGFSRKFEKRTGFYYPAVSKENWAIVPVTKEGTADSEIDAAFKNIGPSCCFPKDTTVGRSCTLAMMLATLTRYGVKMLPGNYSGEVTDIEVVGYKNYVKSVDFTILPVDFEDGKIKASIDAGSKLSGLFADGWFESRRFLNFCPDSLLYDDHCQLTFTKITPPPGYPGFGVRVSISRIASA